jgi:hypothetical protein
LFFYLPETTLLSHLIFLRCENLISCSFTRCSFSALSPPSLSRCCSFLSRRFVSLTSASLDQTTAGPHLNVTLLVAAAAGPSAITIANTRSSGSAIVARSRAQSAARDSPKLISRLKVIDVEGLKSGTFGDLEIATKRTWASAKV